MTGTNENNRNNIGNDFTNPTRFTGSSLSSTPDTACAVLPYGVVEPTSLTFGAHDLTNQSNGNQCDVGALLHPLELVASAMQRQGQNTVINEQYIRDHFTGEQQTALLNLMRDLHIGNITLGPAGANGDRPVSINFTQDVSVGPLTLPTTLNGTLHFVPGGFEINNLQGPNNQNVQLLGVRISALRFDGTTLTLVTPPGVPNITTENEDALAVVRTVNTAIGAFRP